MTKSTLFQLVKEEIQKDYGSTHCNVSYDQFLSFVEKNPYHYTRTAFQITSDMIDHFGKKTITDCGEEITRYNLFNDPFDRASGSPYGKHAVYGIDRELHALVNYIQTTARKGGDERILLLHGPPGTAKTSIINLFIKGLEAYSLTKEGGLYSFDWVFTEDSAFQDIGFKLPHKRQESQTSLAYVKEEDLFVRVPCQINDHPLMLLPKNKRRKYLEKVIENHPDIIIPRMILENELCRNCKTINDKLLHRYEGDFEKVLNHVKVLRLQISEVGQIGAATVPAGQNIEAHAPLIVRESTWYQNLASLFPGISIHQFQGKWADANRGIIHFTDIFKKDVRYHANLLSAVQEHVQDFQGVQATIDTLIIATTNIEELVQIQTHTTNRALLDRTRIQDLPYVLNVDNEKRIYKDKFKEAGYSEEQDTELGHHIMPHIRKYIALFSVMTRFLKPAHTFYREFELDQETLEVITNLSPVQKAYLYNGEMPPELTTKKKKILSNPTIQRLIRQEYNPLEGINATTENTRYLKEGLAGISPRVIKEIISDVIGKKEDREARKGTKGCLGVKGFHERLEELVKKGKSFLNISYEEEKQYLKPNYFLYATKREYDAAIQQDVQWAMIGISKSTINQQINEYVKHVLAWSDNSEIYNPKTKKHEPPSEQKMTEFEYLIELTNISSPKYRHQLVRDIAHAQTKAQTKAEKEGRMQHPQLNLEKLFEEHYETIYDSLFVDAIEKMKMTQDEFKRTVSWLGTDKVESINPDALQEMKRITTNLKKRADYCDSCAIDALKYVVFDLEWEF